MRALRNIFNLGVKELRSVKRDPVILGLIVWAFTLAIITASNARPEALQNAAIAIVDEDRSVLSGRIADALYAPYFKPPEFTDRATADDGLDKGRYFFSLTIPSGFQADLVAGRRAEVQLNVDATGMTQAFTGSGYVQQIVQGQVDEFLARVRSDPEPPVDIAVRAWFNPSLIQRWFESVMQIINNVTLLSLVLTGAALIREREHGTIEHLLVMPVTPFQIMASKIWSMGLVVLVASSFGLTVIVQRFMQVPINGSVPLFLAGAVLHLFAMTSIGIFLGTIARSMPQFGLLLLLIYMPLQMLSGGQTPRENMPEILQNIMLAAPTTHFVKMAQAILFRDAGMSVVWPQFLALAVIGGVFSAYTLWRFRRTIGQMA